MGSEQSSSNKERILRDAASKRDMEKALEEQRKMYEQKMRDLLRESKANNAAAVQQLPQNTNLERQRNPYSYTYDDLPSAASDSHPWNLYPNLANTGNTYVSPRTMGSTNSSTFQQNSVDPGKFVFVNNHQSPEVYKPSAPPIEKTLSQSRPRGEDEDITCPTCGKRYGERIYQCNMGHSSCHLCKMRQVACGICHYQLTDRRNFEVEKYVADRKVKCPNSDDGCRLYIKPGEIESHEKECPFKVMKCPSLSLCRWQGKLSQLVTHFDACHPWERHGEVDKEMFLSNICNEDHTVSLIKIGNFNFLFHLRVAEAERRLYMAAQLIGTKHSAAKWGYEIHVYNKRQPRRKFHYTDRCTSSIDPIEEIYKNTQCCVIPQQYAQTFINEGSLAYKFYIKKDDDKRDGAFKKEPANRRQWKGKRLVQNTAN